MFLDRERYVELKEWNKFGISAIYTKKNYGNIKEMSKEKILKDFSLEGKYIVSGFQTHSDNIAVVDSLEKHGLVDNSVMISRCGLPEEEIISDIKLAKDKKVNYLSTILARRKK